jgi:hypothetical protein
MQRTKYFTHLKRKKRSSRNTRCITKPLLRFSEKKCHPKVSTFVLEMFRERNYGGASWATGGLLVLCVRVLSMTHRAVTTTSSEQKGTNANKKSREKHAYPFVSKVTAQAVVWPICVLSPSFCLSLKLGGTFFSKNTIPYSAFTCCVKPRTLNSQFETQNSKAENRK